MSAPPSKRTKLQTDANTAEIDAAVLRKAKELVLEKRTISIAPPPGFALIRIVNVGICGSDVEYWQHGRIGDFVLKAPMIIGHECSGVVERVNKGEIGANSSIAVGDRVALEPGIPCRHCRRCLSGYYNLCEGMKFFATPPVDGSLCTYVLHPLDFCFKLPENVSLEEGALCEPLSVGVHACRRANIKIGSRVCILGAGPIGLVCLLVAKAYGAEFLEVAKSMGADLVINVLDQSAQQTNTTLQECDINVSIECCGLESATKTAIAVTGAGGCVCCVGLHDPTMNIPIMDASVREVDIKGIFRYRNAYPACISMLATKRIDVSKLVTHRFALNELVHAFQTARTSADAIKVMFTLE